jgi:hypothetical protein
VEIFSAEKSAGVWRAFRPREAVPEVDLKKHQLIQGLWSAGQRDYKRKGGIYHGMRNSKPPFSS